MTVADSHSTTRLSAHVEMAKGDVLTTYEYRTWKQFKYFQKSLEDVGVRLSFYDGVIGVLMPGRAHEIFKKLIGFLIEFFLHHKRVEFVAIGSTTQEKEGFASAEPDESYEIENLKLAIEVNFTSGDLFKLERYKMLGFNEVWIWEDGVLDVYHLQEGVYKKVDHSLIPALSSLDLEIMSECILIGETSRIAAGDRLLAAHFV